MFTQQFNRFACSGDTIESPLLIAGKLRTGFRLVATLYSDDDKTPPDERQDGFWPSLDPKSDGYIGAKSKTTLARHTAHAQLVMDEWKDDNWEYVGVAVRAYFNDIPLTDEFAHACWGIECNYPTRGKTKRNPNAYLSEVACDLYEDCARDAMAVFAAMVETAVKSLEESE